MPLKGAKYSPLPIYHEDYKAKELEKMVASIYLDGDDKVEELNVIADEAYHHELYYILSKAIHEINVTITKKEQRVIMGDIWHSSYLEHRAMIDLMTARYKIIEEILQDTKQQLKLVSKNAETFTSVTKALLLQALVQMMDNHVICRVKRRDASKMDGVISWCEKSFNKLTGAQVTVELDDSEYLDDSTYGGVVIFSSNGQISIDNTLSQRFVNMKQRAGSIIRLYLFGPPLKRRFLT